MTEFPIIAETDVLVCGGGPAGFAAAIASARGGARTMLVERYGFPGGMMTSGYVNPIYGFFARHIQVVRGIGQELIDNLLEMQGGTTGHRYRLECVGKRRKSGECLSRRDEKACPVACVSNVCAVDSERAKVGMIQMLKGASVTCFYHATVTDVVLENDEITGVMVHGKSGTGFVKAKIFIDSTGDGDIAALANLSYKKGFGNRPLFKPPSLMFKISGVDSTHDRIQIDLPDPREGEETFAWLMALPEDGEYTVNAPSGLVGFDSTDFESLSRGQESATEAMFALYNWIKENHKACDKIKLKGFAPNIGVRDSRRIEGRYTLTENDVLSARKFPESGIANGVHPIDLHIKDKQFENKHLMPMPCGDYYQIPYDCLLPKNGRNLIVAGRSISATFLAQGSLRVMATCMAIGQAAGSAAAMTIDQNIPVFEVSAIDLRQCMKNQGEYLGEESNIPAWNLGLEPLPDDIRKKAYPG